jgi:DnaJ-domain-containing protein 1
MQTILRAVFAIRNAKASMTECRLRRSRRARDARRPTMVHRLLDPRAMRPVAPALQKLRSIAIDHEASDDDATWIDLDQLGDDGEVKMLPRDLVSAVRATEARLDELDAYSLMGVEHDAEWGEIQRAYRQRLATYHPNRWSGYDLEGLRSAMERIAQRISFAFAFLAEEAARHGSLAAFEEPPTEGSTPPVDLAELDLDLAGDRPTFPTSVVRSIPSPARARPPRPPPRKAG